MANDRQSQRRGSVSWTKSTIVTLSPKPVRSETLPTSQSIAFERKEVRGQSIASAKHSSMKSVNEIEEELLMNDYRPVNMMRVKRNDNRLDSNPMTIASDQNREFRPLYSTKPEGEYSRIFPENTRAFKYHFPSRTITRKNPSSTKERTMSSVVGNCFKESGCLFAITACSLGIAALIFAKLALHKIFSLMKIF